MKTTYVRACEALESEPTLKAREVAERIGVKPPRVCAAFHRNGVRFSKVRAEIANKQQRQAA